MDLGLTGKRALVTGAHRGTGAGIAAALAAEGAEVLVHGHLPGEAEGTVATILAAGHRAIGLAGDLMSDAGAERLAAAAGPVDILVNNYGLATRGSWETSLEDDWLDMYQRNVMSAARMARLLAPYMTTQCFGRIINLGTIGSTRPAARMPHYYAAKGALATLNSSLAKELAAHGITVNLVSPGLIRTREVEEMFRARATKEGWGDDWGTIAARIAATEMPNPTGRVAEVAEVADMVCFLASHRAGFITGVNIRIDGGATDVVG
jgi:NAD(P)-dependent dehydrogenase (short-subunit alcohol dehydrogenase family)